VGKPSRIEWSEVSRQVRSGKIKKRWGLTEKEEVIAWNYAVISG
jgi:hypothetical protein